jgi:hypothetical protein
VFGSYGAEGQGWGRARLTQNGVDARAERGEKTFLFFPLFFCANPVKWRLGQSVSQSVKHEIMKPMKQSTIIKWNTGRHYAAAGQRIAATLLDDGTTVYFVDIDRMIDGHIPNGTLERNAIMRAYDYYSRECASIIEGYPYDQRCTQSGYDRRMEIYNALREAAEAEAL